MAILAFRALILLIPINLIVGLTGAIVREPSEGAACSGDFYKGDDEPEPYLWF